MEPKSVPGASKSDFKCLFAFGLCFKTDFNDSWAQHGLQKRPPAVAKWTPEPFKIRLRGPKGSQRPPGSPPGGLLKPFWLQMGPSGSLRGPMLAPFWSHFGVIFRGPGRTAKFTKIVLPHDFEGFRGSEKHAKSLEKQLTPRCTCQERLGSLEEAAKTNERPWGAWGRARARREVL